MSATIIDGKKIAAEIKNIVRTQIEKKTSTGARPPGLAVILLGNDSASEVYVKNKNLACEQVGIYSKFHQLPNTVSQEELISIIQELNQDPKIDGILLQLPLPAHINSDQMLEYIDPRKDVDGFHPYNIGRLAQRTPLLRPCTPFGIMQILKNIKQPFKQKHAVVVGASNIVGRPMAMELLIAGSTVTVCHRFTHQLDYFVGQADILISAVGKPGIIKGEWIKMGATVIDVGMNRLADGSFTGDVEFDSAVKRAAWITPVPGGVGPMTVAMLLVNTLIAAGYDLSNLFTN